MDPQLTNISKRLFDTKYVMIRYGTMYEIIFPHKGGHLSIGVELKADATAVVRFQSLCASPCNASVDIMSPSLPNLVDRNITPSHILFVQNLVPDTH